MTATLGSFALALAMLAAAGAAVAAIAAAVNRQAALLQVSRRLIAGCAALVTAAVAMLLIALAQSDFSLAYVASYTERALPWGFKLAALWAGQEGSLLLWGWLIAVMSVAAVWRAGGDAAAGRGSSDPSTTQTAAVHATLAIVTGFFIAVLVFAADPFQRLPVPALDGHGLNPLLQHPAMVAHPPLLFIGYAGFTVPFALLMGALVAGREDDRWIGQTRPWLLIAWLFLSAGILLGAQWAYVELGWGGYWAWDPVENASLLPWLTGTAAIHSISVQRYRGLFRRWNAALLAGTFALCLFATYLTRSGVIQSVHAFGESLIGTLFLAFLVVTLTATLAVLVWRRKLLRPSQPEVELGIKTKAFLTANVLLTLIAAITLIGTTMPILTSAFTDEPVSVGPAFYNIVVGPLAVLLLAVMATGPLLRDGEGGMQLWRASRVPLAVAGAATAIVAMTISVNLWALAAAAVVAFALAAIAADFITRLRIERGRDPRADFVRMIDGAHWRYGGQLVHLGMIMILLGVVGSSLFSEKQTLQMKPGQTATVGRYTLTYHTIEQQRYANYTAVLAHVEARKGDRVAMLHPQMRFYDKAKDAHAEVALRTNLREDLYVTLAGWEEGGRLVAMQAIVNPLVLWIWIGGVTLVLGAVLSLTPSLLPRRGTVTKPAKAGEAAGRRATAPSAVP